MAAAFVLRLAGPEDCADIYRWRNDPVTRNNSFNTEPIPYEAHVKWYQGALNDGSKIILIAVNDQEKIGMVRFDLKPAGEALINVVIAPEKRGQGFGSVILEKACQYIFDQTAITNITAEIKKENVQSIKAFFPGKIHDR